MGKKRHGQPHMLGLGGSSMHTHGPAAIDQSSLSVCWRKEEQGRECT